MALAAVWVGVFCGSCRGDGAASAPASDSPEGDSRPTVVLVLWEDLVRPCGPERAPGQTAPGLKRRRAWRSAVHAFS